jgi:hypothetical protein
MHLDELAKLVGNAVLIALDDRGVRDRQSQRTAKQRYHRVPVGEAADGRGFGKGCNKAERRMQMQQSLRRTNSAKVPASTRVASALTRRNSAARAASPEISNENVPVTMAFGPIQALLPSCPASRAHYTKPIMAAV